MENLELICKVMSYKSLMAIKKIKIILNFQKKCTFAKKKEYII